MERLLALFADILDYPKPGLAELARSCEAALDEYPFGRDAAVAEGLRGFREFAQETPVGKIEELYAEAFDLCRERCPYVGYHLFGDGPKRSRFLQELNARYRASGFSIGCELPDHLPTMLRFLARCEDGAEREVILREAIQPALEKITATDNPVPGYDPALKSLAAALKGG